MTYAWIAVALATAIRLLAGAQWWSAGAVLVIALVAIIIGRRASRIAAAFLLVASIIDAASLWRVHDVEQNFDRRANEHLAGDVARVRAHIAELETELDAAAARIAARSKNVTDRAQLFRILAPEASKAGRGARILDAEGNPIAWFGEDYRAPGDRTYQFDVTNLYITRARGNVQAFARIENVPGARVSVHPEDEWTVSMYFHGGFPRKEPHIHRFKIAERDGSALWIDTGVREKSQVLERMRGEGSTAAAIVLALGALLINLKTRSRSTTRRSPPCRRHRACRWSSPRTRKSRGSSARCWPSRRTPAI
jgi:hypothetical protein